jgi:hypothetical protein
MKKLFLTLSILLSTVSGLSGYWATNSSMLVNNVSSPVLRSAVVSPIAAGAGHIAGGTAAGLFQGRKFGEAFANSFDGIGRSMAIGVASTIGVSYANGINPWTGEKYVYRTVDVTELNSIKNDNAFSLHEGGVELKYFAKTYKDAQCFGERPYPDRYTIVKGTIPAKINVNNHWYPNVDIIGTYAFAKYYLCHFVMILECRMFPTIESKM